MPKRRTNRRLSARQSGGGFFDSLKNGFRRVFTSAEPTAQASTPTAAPTMPPTPQAVVAPAPPALPTALPPQAIATPPIGAPVAMNRRRPNVMRNIMPPPTNMKGGRTRRRNVRRTNRR